MGSIATEIAYRTIRAGASKNARELTEAEENTPTALGLDPEQEWAASGMSGT